MANRTAPQDEGSDDSAWLISREHEDHLDWLENQEREAEAAERARLKAAARVGMFTSIWEFFTKPRRPAGSGD